MDPAHLREGDSLPLSAPSRWRRRRRQLLPGRDRDARSSRCSPLRFDAVRIRNEHRLDDADRRTRIVLFAQNRGAQIVHVDHVGPKDNRSPRVFQRLLVQSDHRIRVCTIHERERVVRIDRQRCRQPLNRRRELSAVAMVNPESAKRDFVVRFFRMMRAALGEYAEELSRAPAPSRRRPVAVQPASPKGARARIERCPRRARDSGVNIRRLRTPQRVCAS